MPARDETQSRPGLKRFYKEAAVAPAAGGFGVRLDGRTLRTPGKQELIAPTRGLAEAVAAEWAAQGAKIEPASMPMTQLLNTAIERVPREMFAIECMHL